MTMSAPIIRAAIPREVAVISSVEPERVGQGIAHRLIEHSKKKAAELGVGQISVQGDTKAVAFYEQAGGIRRGQRVSGRIPERFLPKFRISLECPERKET